ncbi:acetyl-CoA acetyltransferase [Aeromicrobium phragmitis]|uniref:Acetyl-CoA acetyltransferase n=1 Tax=Aeromicrobium phragmitis TaxID=2478914 RepID=A0A3L8PPB2_9ACTN|nr:acetyl-CoA acetyltransferase [Aeromicrobium phragmitis]RLV57255.1 acetyl-CoA acetyltransferase [Aeromicrobium phragmitis]
MRDRVAIISMACTPFGDHWDKSAADLLVDAATETFAAVGLSPQDVDAYWLGTKGSGDTGKLLSQALRLADKPVTRVENVCATGSDAFRNACLAVASGEVDIAMAIGVEKLKDSGYSGLTRSNPPNDATGISMTAPAAFGMLAPAYAQRYGLDLASLRQVLTRLAWKNYANGAANPRAQYQTVPSPEAIEHSPRVTDLLRIHDCSGVADGAAAAIVVRAEDAARYVRDPLYVKALSFVVGNGEGLVRDHTEFSSIPEVVRSAQQAYDAAGVGEPRRDLALAEVHDCFTPTELVLMEDLGFSRRGEGWRDVLAGDFDRDGALPVNPDGGLKSFGHPIGASGLRMLYECWLQLRSQAPPERQIDLQGRTMGLTQNLGGPPGDCVSFVAIVGTQLSENQT